MNHTNDHGKNNLKKHTQNKEQYLQVAIQS
jgi:hypothetical protein